MTEQAHSVAPSKSASTGFDESKFSGYLTQFRYSQKADAVVASNDYAIYRDAMTVVEQHVRRPLRDMTMLEIGCGQRFATSLLFHSSGARVTGIDMDYVDPRFTLRGYWKIFRANGAERAVKTAIRHLLLDKAYYDVIRNSSGLALKFDDLDLRVMDACHLEFPDNHFDYIFSRAVFEHIYDVRQACTELRRVLKPGGIADIRPHLYPSLSGGHNPEWFITDPGHARKTVPWDHLRRKAFQPPCYLNKLRERDYLAIFGEQFTILQVDSEYLGEPFLTDAIERELAGQYNREELLKVSIRMILRKEA